MYLRPRFLEELHAIREEMSRECDYDMDLFVQMIRNNESPNQGRIYSLHDHRQNTSSKTQSKIVPSHKKK